MTNTEATKTPVDLAAPRDGLSRTERFVLSLADTLAAASPERAALLEVTREVTQYGSEILAVFSPGPRWFDHAITVHASRHAPRSPELAALIGKGRRTWHFGGASVIGKVGGRTVEGKTYTRAQTVVEVYGR